MLWVRVAASAVSYNAAGTRAQCYPVLPLRGAVHEDQRSQCSPGNGAAWIEAGAKAYAIIKASNMFGVD
jgi:hypothetical protein